MQTTKRRSGIFPFLPLDSALTRVRALGRTRGEAPAPLLDTAEKRQVAVGAMIMARGQRFPLHQIGSIFGSE